MREKYNDEDKISDIIQALLHIDFSMLVPGKHRAEAHSNRSFYKGPWQNSSL